MKMSEYIMECDINTASCGDIEVAKHYAEMCVSAAIVESYSKYMTICEYATNPDEFNIVMESADDTDTTKKNADESGKKWYQKIIDWIKSVVNNVITAVTRIDINKLKKMLKQLEADGVKTLDMPRGAAVNISKVMDLYTDFSEMVISKNIHVDEYKALSEEAKPLQKSTDFSENKVTSPIGKMIVEIEELIASDISTKGKMILKKLDYSKKNFENGIGDTSELISAIKTAANDIAKAYTVQYKNFMDMSGEIVREYNKKNKQSKKDNDPKKKPSIVDKVKADWKDKAGRIK